MASALSKGWATVREAKTKGARFQAASCTKSDRDPAWLRYGLAGVPFSLLDFFGLLDEIVGLLQQGRTLVGSRGFVSLGGAAGRFR